MSPIRLLAALMLAAAFVAPHVVAQGRTSLASEQRQQEKKKEQPPAPLIGELVTVDVERQDVRDQDRGGRRSEVQLQRNH